MFKRSETAVPDFLQCLKKAMWRLLRKHTDLYAFTSTIKWGCGVYFRFITSILSLDLCNRFSYSIILYTNNGEGRLCSSQQHFQNNPLHYASVKYLLKLNFHLLWGRFSTWTQAEIKTLLSQLFWFITGADYVQCFLKHRLLFAIYYHYWKRSSRKKSSKTRNNLNK